MATRQSSNGSDEESVKSGIMERHRFDEFDKEPTALASILPESQILRERQESSMARHLTRARLVRGVTGAISALVLCAVAAFTLAHHFAA